MRSLPPSPSVVLAIDVFVALWAPADLIIEDAIGPTTLDLVELTSVNFPLPLPTEHVTPQGIKVKSDSAGEDSAAVS